MPSSPGAVHLMDSEAAGAAVATVTSEDAVRAMRRMGFMRSPRPSLPGIPAGAVGPATLGGRRGSSLGNKGVGSSELPFGSDPETRTTGVDSRRDEGQAWGPEKRPACQHPAAG